MNKKYFSVLLMGAMTVATVGTVTSCKDYDDDISNLQEQIDKLSETIKNIQTQINNGAILTSVTPTENGMTITLNQNGQTKNYTISNGKDGQNGKSWKIGDNGNWWYDEGNGYVDSKFPARGENGKDGENGNNGENGAAGENGENGKYYVPNPETGCFDIYQDGKKLESTNIPYTATAENAITATWEKGVLTLVGVKDAVDGKIVLNLNSVLRAMVFNPSHYVDGVEAIDLATYTYQPLGVKKVDADGDFATDAPFNALLADGVTVESPLYFAPDMKASYFLNPSNADVTEEAKDYKFLMSSAKYTDFTRAAATSIFTVKKVENKDGKLNVTAKYDGEAIKQLEYTWTEDREMTLVALQYTKDDATVTSDFATLTTSDYSNVHILSAQSAFTDWQAWLFTDANTAITSDKSTKDLVTPVAEVKYDNDKGIDLRSLIRTSWTVKYNPVTVETTNATEEKVKEAGFKYSFELVGYHTGVNETSQSAHAAIAADGYTLRPQAVDDNGKQQAYGAAQTRAIIGREPLVRVILNDTVHNKIAAVAYMKIKIAENVTTADPTQITKDFADNTAFTLNCDDANPALNKKVTWYEIENKILADKQVNMSKVEFEDTYQLDGPATDLTQFDKNTINANAISPKIGKVIVTTADVNGTMTQVLQWTMSGNEAYTHFNTADATGKKPTSISTYVRYTLKSGKTAPNKYIYVKFTWTPSAININPVANFGNQNKIQKAWYAANNLTAGSGYDEIHGNVEQMGKPTSNDEFKFDIKNNLLGNKITVDQMAAPYDKLNSTVAANAQFTFVTDTDNGFYASADGLTLYGDRDETYKIATMTSDGIVTLSKDAKTLEKLNRWSPKNIDKVLTARVAVKSSLCWGAGIKINNSAFNVKFIRPISVESATAEFTDAVATTSDVKLTFKNWNGYDFTDPNRAFPSTDYFNYYKVSGIELNIGNATTDLNGVEKKLSEVTSKIELTYTAPALSADGYIVANQYGKLTYNNNGLTVGTFHITIPAKITYEWGVLDTKVVVTVKESQVARTVRK
ncbi:hypothetical protein CIK96_07355 [Prevotella sp. P4-98]|uniref:hypothetical protein n=1 Tax=Prevotella sp. P4-98 TaxID=2024219 RepID=UPI000B977660|nr:hypothetical protein [Prevotella sp. P4-98]OYP45745.1 hypothetical protein CIK96_07355 [Prevotella sp. P4-98]